MSEMIDRVALAIDGAMIDSQKMECGERQKFVARAAIKAMREPTKEMIEAGTKADWVGEDESRAGRSIMPHTYEMYDDELNDVVVKTLPGIWESMIDAALNEKSPPPPKG
jgi:hypothetical protein